MMVGGGQGAGFPCGKAQDGGAADAAVGDQHRPVLGGVGPIAADADLGMGHAGQAAEARVIDVEGEERRHQRFDRLLQLDQRLEQRAVFQGAGGDTDRARLDPLC